MRTKLLSSLMALGLVLGACARKDEAAPTTTTAAPEVKADTPAKADDAPASPIKLPDGIEEIVAQQQKSADEFAKSLDEEKVKKLIAYEEVIAEHSGLILGAAAHAAQAAGGDPNKMGAELNRDERMKKITEITEKALADNGVTQGEVANWTTLVSSITAGELAVQDARKKLAELEKKNPQSVMLQIYRDQIAEQDTARQEFADKHGAELLTILDRHMPKIIEIRQKQMDAVMGRKAK